MRKRLHAQRKFAQGVPTNYQSPAPSASPSTPIVRPEGPPENRYIIKPKVSAKNLLDYVSFNRMHTHRQPIVLLERLAANNTASTSNGKQSAEAHNKVETSPPPTSSPVVRRAKQKQNMGRLSMSLRSKASAPQASSDIDEDKPLKYLKTVNKPNIRITRTGVHAGKSNYANGVPSKEQATTKRQIKSHVKPARKPQGKSADRETRSFKQPAKSTQNNSDNISGIVRRKRACAVNRREEMSGRAKKTRPSAVPDPAPVSKTLRTGIVKSKRACVVNGKEEMSGRAKKKYYGSRGIFRWLTKGRQQPSKTPPPAVGPAPAPVSAPEPTPVSVPDPASDSAPVSAPNFATVSAPDPAPVSAPDSAPIFAPDPAPVSAPVSAPDSAPNPALVFAPDPAPVSVPDPAPVSAPDIAPISAADSAPVPASDPAPASAPELVRCVSETLRTVRDVMRATGGFLAQRCTHCQACRRVRLLRQIAGFVTSRGEADGRGDAEDALEDEESVTSAGDDTAAGPLADVYSFDEQDAPAAPPPLYVRRSPRPAPRPPALDEARERELYLDLHEDSSLVIQMTYGKIPNSKNRMMQARLVKRSEATSRRLFNLVEHGHLLDQLLRTLAAASSPRAPRPPRLRPRSRPRPCDQSTTTELPDIVPRRPADINSRIPADMNSRIPADMNPRIPADMNPQVPADVDPRRPAVMNPRNPADMNQRRFADMNPQVPADVDPRRPADMNPRIPADMNPQVPADVDPRRPAVMNPRNPADMNQRRFADMNPQVPADVDPRRPADMNPRIPADMNPQVPGDVDPRRSADMNSRIPADMNPRRSADMKPQVTADVDPRRPADINPRRSADIHPQIPSVVDPRRLADTNSRRSADVVPRRSADLNPRIPADVDLRRPEDIKPQISVDVDPRGPVDLNPRNSSDDDLRRPADMKPRIPADVMDPPARAAQIPPPPAEPARLIEAPTYYPTEEEFNDPIAYFEKIAPKAAKYGICKVSAPASFRPVCVLNEELKFRVSNHYIPRLYNRWGPAARELSAMRAYLFTQGGGFSRVPLLHGLEVNVSSLKRAVQACGGVTAVLAQGQWPAVAERMGYPRANAPATHRALDNYYVKYLLPYDTATDEEREAVRAAVDRCWQRKHRRNVRWAQNPLHPHYKLLGDTDSSDDEEAASDGPLGAAADRALYEVEDCIVPGRYMNLTSFRKVAAHAMAVLMGVGEEGPEPDTEGEEWAELVEREYWRLVELGEEHVCVHAASIDTTAGHGFSRHKDHACHKHPWNLKMLRNNAGNVLRNVGEVQGVTVPTLHLNMLFSTSCWHRDPHGLQWMEYNHQGPRKIWYGIPASESDKFRAAVEALCPTSCQNKSVWLSSDITMIPPERLLERGVSLARVTQRPGEFIVVFPNAYSCSVATGLTVSESVYFATTSWLHTVHPLFEGLRSSCEPTAFPLERLVVRLARGGGGGRATLPLQEHVVAAYPAVCALLNRELRLREQLAATGLPMRVCVAGRGGEWGVWRARDHDECHVCRATLYFSKVTGVLGNKSQLCLQHALRVLGGAGGVARGGACELVVAYEEATLRDLLARVERCLTDAPADNK